MSAADRKRFSSTIVLVVASIGLIAGAALAFLDRAAFVAAWMPVAFWILDLSLGALVVRWIFDATGGRWGAVSVPAMQVCASALPLGLAAALLCGWSGRTMLEWIAQPGTTPRAFLAPEALALRSLVYVLVWMLLALGSGTWGGRERYPSRWSAIALIVHMPLATLWALDWFGALQAEWFSTALGPAYLTSQAVAGFAVVTLLESLRGEARAPQAIADLGTLLFASIVFWAYVAFMQFLIIWMGDLPREVTWYVDRSAPGWIALLGAALILKLLIPAVLLCSRRMKQRRIALATIAVGVLIGHLLHLIWQLAPAFGAAAPRLATGVPFAMAGLGGGWLFIVKRSVARREIDLRVRLEAT